MGNRHERRARAISLFCEHLDGLGEGGAPDVRSLCASHPDLEAELRDVGEEYLRARGAVGAATGRGAEEIPGSVARYVVQGEIARGGMGAILRVWDAELHRTLAMKVLRREPPGGDPRETLKAQRRRSRLLTEAQILGQLEHPGIVPVHEVGRNEDGELYFTMQLVRGRSLSEIFHIVRRGEEEWTTTRVVGVVQRVCEAVAYAHSKGVIHRDLKPANVMVGAFGETYVMDWGLARARGRSGPAAVKLRETRVGFPPKPPGSAADAGGASVWTDRRGASGLDPESPLLTAAGDVVGTPAYMPPEQAAGRLDEVDERSDVYGVGAILYELLAGVPPYADRELSPRDLLSVVVREPPEAIEKLARDAPPELVAICKRASARDRSGRYGSMAELAEDLRAYLEGHVVRAHSTGPLVELRKWMSRHRAVAGLLLALLVLVIGSAVTFSVLHRMAAERGRAAAAAQFDALRRMNALRTIAPSGTQLPSFVEDFSRDVLDRRWVASGQSDLVSVRNGRLRLESRGGQRPTTVELDPYVSVILGDFDVSVDFFLEDFTVPELGAERQAILAIYRADTKQHVMRIGRHVEENSIETGSLTHTYRIDNNQPFVEGNDMEGRLRFTRSGGRIGAYFWRDGWVELHSKERVTAPLVLWLQAMNWYTEEPSAVEFDNLRVLTSFEPPSEPLPAFRDEFSDARIDSRLVVRANGGIASELDGRLYLETLQGRTGSVKVELSSWRWVLRGDASLSVDFELIEFPRPEKGKTTLSLVLAPEGGGTIGAIQIVSSPDGLRCRAYRHWGEKSVSFEGTSGSLRIERRGTDVVCLYRDEEWHELFVSPNVDTSLDAYFAIELRSSDRSGVVVGLDNLDVSSMTEKTNPAPDATSSAEPR